MKKVDSSLEEKIDQIVSGRRKSLLIIFILAVIAYGNIFLNTSMMDDFRGIPSGPLTKDQGTSAAFHMVSILIQLAGVYIIYQLTSLLTANSFISCLTALLFALHPVHVESIAPIASIPATLGAIFLFFAFYYYIKGVGYEGALMIAHPLAKSFAPRVSIGSSSGWLGLASRVDYARALVFALLAIFMQELAISLPFLFLFYDYFFSHKQKSLRFSLRRVSPYFLLTIFFVVSKWLVLGGITRGHYLNNSFYLTAMVMIKAWAKYVGLLLFPVTLTHNHIISDGIFSYDQKDFDSYAVLSQSPLDPQVFLSFVVLSTIVMAGWAARLRRPLVTFCIGWFFMTLLPVSNIIPGSIYFAERYLYPGSWAFCLLVSYGIYRLYTNQRIGSFSVPRRVVLACAAVLIVLYAGRTLLRNRDWKDQLTVYEAAVKANPQSASLRNDLGIVYLRAGELVKSKQSFEKAIAMSPNDPHFYFSAEETYSFLEQYDKAIEYLNKAIELNPEFAEAYFNLAGIHAYLEKEDQARYYLQQTVDLYRRQNRILEAGKAISKIEDYFKSLKDAEQDPVPPDLPQDESR